MRHQKRWILAVCLVVASFGIATAGESKSVYQWVEVDEHGERHHERIEIDGPRPFLGVEMGPLSEDGIRLMGVVEGSPAERAGLQEGDFLVAISGEPIETSHQVQRAVLRSEVGDWIDVEIVRDGDRQTLSAQLEGAEEPHRAWGYRMKAHRRGPKLGITPVEATAELRRHLGSRDDEGVLVGSVIDGSAAQEAGIEVGDLIIAIDGESVDSSNDLRQLLQERAGETFRIDLVRDQRTTNVRATLDSK